MLDQNLLAKIVFIFKALFSQGFEAISFTVAIFFDNFPFVFDVF